VNLQGQGGARESTLTVVELSNGDISHCLNAGGMGRIDYETETLVTHALTAEGFDASEDGTGRGSPLGPVAIPILEAGARTGKSTDDLRAGIGIGDDGDPMYTLQSGKQHAVLAFQERGRTGGRNLEYQENLAYSLNNPGAGGRAQERCIAFSCKDSGADSGPVSPTLRAMEFDGSHANAGGQVAVAFQTHGSNIEAGRDISGTLASNGDRASGSAPCVAFDTTQITSKANRPQPKDGDACHPVTSQGHPPALAFRAAGQDGFVPRELSPPIAESDGGGSGVPSVMTVSLRGREGGATAELGDDVAGSLRVGGGGGGDKTYIPDHWAVRRLTPVECERLQSFKDGYTDVEYRGKPAADGPRYRALGNSMCVNVVAWIGRRIMENL
jgi:DNA (cytosine-5)-methyltransferase 1